jgi:hypothetical protein
MTTPPCLQLNASAVQYTATHSAYDGQETLVSAIRIILLHAQASQRHDKVRVQKKVGTQVWCCAAPLPTASHAVSATEQEYTPPAQGRVAEQPAAKTWPYV